MHQDESYQQYMSTQYGGESSKLSKEILRELSNVLDQETFLKISNVISIIVRSQVLGILSADTMQDEQIQRAIFQTYPDIEMKDMQYQKQKTLMLYNNFKEVYMSLYMYFQEYYVKQYAETKEQLEKQRAEEVDRHTKSIVENYKQTLKNKMDMIKTRKKAEDAKKKKEMEKEAEKILHKFMDSFEVTEESGGGGGTSMVTTTRDINKIKTSFIKGGILDPSDTTNILVSRSPQQQSQQQDKEKDQEVQEISLLPETLSEDVSKDTDDNEVESKTRTFSFEESGDVPSAAQLATGVITRSVQAARREAEHIGFFKKQMEATQETQNYREKKIEARRQQYQQHQQRIESITKSDKLLNEKDEPLWCIYDEKSTNIYILWLSPKVTEDRQKDLFIRYGDIVSLKIYKNKHNGIVIFLDHKSAKDAIKNLQNRMFFGSPLQQLWGKYFLKDMQNLSTIDTIRYKETINNNKHQNINGIQYEQPYDSDKNIVTVPINQYQRRRLDIIAQYIATYGIKQLEEQINSNKYPELQYQLDILNSDNNDTKKIIKPIWHEYFIWRLCQWCLEGDGEWITNNYPYKIPLSKPEQWIIPPNEDELQKDEISQDNIYEYRKYIEQYPNDIKILELSSIWSDTNITIPLQEYNGKYILPFRDEIYTREDFYLFDNIEPIEYIKQDIVDSVETITNIHLTQIHLNIYIQQNLYIFYNGLQCIKGSKIEIEKLTVFALDNPQWSECIVQIQIESLNLHTTPLYRKLARLYVISDILCNSTETVRKNQYRSLFQRKLKEAFQGLSETIQRIPSRITCAGFRESILSVIQVWEQRAIFPAFVFVDLKSTV